jgi:hypothetical protein
VVAKTLEALAAEWEGFAWRIRLDPELVHAEARAEVWIAAANELLRAAIPSERPACPRCGRAARPWVGRGNEGMTQR